MSTPKKPWTAATGDGRTYCDEHTPPGELRDHFFNVVYRGTHQDLNGNTWAMLLSGLFGHSEGELYQLFVEDAGTLAITKDEARERVSAAREKVSAARETIARLTAVCDFAEMVLDRGPDTLGHWRKPRPKPAPEPGPVPPPAATLRALPEVLADTNDALSAYDRGEGCVVTAETKAHSEALHAIVWARSRSATGHAVANLAVSLAQLLAVRLENIDDTDEPLIASPGVTHSVGQFEVTATLASLLSEVAQHVHARAVRGAVPLGNGEFKGCNLDWKVSAG